MDTVLCLGSAWEYWHIARIVDDPAMRADPVARSRVLPIPRSRGVLLESGAPRPESLSALQRGFSQLECVELSDGKHAVCGLTLPLHVLAAKGGTYRQAPGRVIHRACLPLPAESLVVIENGLMVSSPEHLYLQAARTLDGLGLVWFASELCSVFSVHPTGAGGILPARPLTTLKKLANYLETACGAGAYGAKNFVQRSACRGACGFPP